MTDQMTPREHDDMRDLLLAGMQRIRPAGSYRALLSAVVAVVLVAGTIGGIVTVALNTGRGDGSPAITGPTPTAIDSDVPTPTPTPTVSQDPIPFDPSALTPSLPSVLPPAPGTHLRPPPDPTQDARIILGTWAWLEGKGIDVRSMQGFQRVAGVAAWTADLSDESGQCILIQKSRVGGGWSEPVCDAAGTPASVEREVDGAVLRFTIVGGAIDAYSVPG